MCLKKRYFPLWFRRLRKRLRDALQFPTGPATRVCVLTHGVSRADVQRGPGGVRVAQSEPAAALEEARRRRRRLRRADRRGEAAASGPEGLGSSRSGGGKTSPPQRRRAEAAGAVVPPPGTGPCTTGSGCRRPGAAAPTATSSATCPWCGAAGVSGLTTRERRNCGAWRLPW